jgi:hypothetical protein
LAAEPVRVAVLDFELNDVGVLPSTAAERERTASLAPMLQESLSESGRYAIAPIAAERQQQANAAFGYLFTHADAAAALAQSVQADWIVVGRLQKSNALFAYVTVQLINARTQKRIGEFYAEIKGPIQNTDLTRRGVKRVAAQIHQAIETQASSSQKP